MKNMNRFGIRDLFSGKDKVISLFLKKCRIDNSICEYDYENIVIQLTLNGLNRNNEFIYFSKANVLDFLEDFGIHINLEVQRDGNYLSHALFVDDDYYETIWTQTEPMSRIMSYENAITNGILELNKKL